MGSAAKLAAFAAVLAGVFGGAMAVGAAVGPIDVGEGAHEMSSSAEPALPRGVSAAADGFRLALHTAVIEPSVPSPLAFEILDAEGRPVVRFDHLHERPLHLIVLSRDLVTYHHLHPHIDPRGTWSVDVPPLAPGSYRVFADFQPAGGEALTLAADVLVPGRVDAVTIPTASSAVIVDGYRVTLSGTPALGSSELSFDVERDGEAVRTDPYLGAAGHLVAIRAADLAYLHVHPHEGATPTVTFTAEFPTAGTYRLFFDFSADGVVRTASFTADVRDAAGTAPADTPTADTITADTTAHHGGH